MKLQAHERDTQFARVAFIVGMILFAAILRVVPHPWNFTPVGAMALFSGAVMRNRLTAFVFPLLALFAGDLFLGLHVLMPVIYASFLLNIVIGFGLREGRTVARLGGAVLLGAIQFFLVSNLGVWWFLNSYPRTAPGLLACYEAAVPFFWNTLAGDALFSGLLFGALYLAERAYPAMRPSECRMS
jgi:hypothetical protein